MRAIFYLLLFHTLSLFSCTLGEAPRLIFLQSLFRHGEKYLSYSIEPRVKQLLTQKDISTGQLTTQGKAAQYQLGKKMYKVYWRRLFGDQSNEEQNNQKKKVSVVSLNMSRAIESAESHLFGLFSFLPPLTVFKHITIPYSQNGKQQSHYLDFTFGKKESSFHPHKIQIQADFAQDYYQLAQKWLHQNLNTPFAQKVNQYKPFIKAVRKFQRFIKIPKGIITNMSYHKYYNDEESMKSLGYQTILKSSSDIFATINIV